MTDRPSETGASEPADPLAEFADQVAEAVGGRAEVSHGTAKVRVEPSAWKEALATTSGDLGLVYLSWLSAIDWADQVAVGDAPRRGGGGALRAAVRGVQPFRTGGWSFSRPTSTTTRPPSRVSQMCTREPTGTSGRPPRCSASTSQAIRTSPSSTSPTTSEGYPLRKAFPLLSREVKPWPGKVDVEDMPENGSGPSTQNPNS